MQNLISQEIPKKHSFLIEVHVSTKQENILSCLTTSNNGLILHEEGLYQKKKKTRRNFSRNKELSSGEKSCLKIILDSGNANAKPDQPRDTKNIAF